jgi:hypothetical protein
MTIRRLGEVLLAASAAVLLMSPAARADIITIHDATDSMFVTHDSGSDTLYDGCSLANGSEDYCYAEFYRPGFFVSSATGPSGEPIPQNNQYTTRVDEPGGGQSDGLLTYAAGPEAIQFLFSDMPSSEGGSSDSCFYGCGSPALTPILETGLPQLASTVTWNDRRVDTFYFVSDTSEVPVGNRVPDGGVTLALLGGAVLGLGALRRRFRE